jgi:hypothetical protein
MGFWAFFGTALGIGLSFICPAIGIPMAAVNVKNLCEGENKMSANVNIGFTGKNQEIVDVNTKMLSKNSDGSVLIYDQRNHEHRSAGNLTKIPPVIRDTSSGDYLKLDVVKTYDSVALDTQSNKLFSNVPLSANNFVSSGNAFYQSVLTSPIVTPWTPQTSTPCVTLQDFKEKYPLLFKNESKNNTPLVASKIEDLKPSNLHNIDFKNSFRKNYVNELDGWIAQHNERKAEQAKLEQASGAVNSVGSLELLSAIRNGPAGLLRHAVEETVIGMSGILD